MLSHMGISDIAHVFVEVEDAFISSDLLHFMWLAG